MQKHEGPSGHHGTAERNRQWVLTKRLLLAIVVMSGALAAMLVERWT